jgi:photosystem II stability/assembly factor-like uncharacterized protein
MKEYRINIAQYYLLISLLVPIELQPQSSVISSGPVREKPIQYRRGTELMEGYQSYEQDYAGKDLEEEKRRLFPLQNGTGIWTELNPKVPRVDYIGLNFVNKDTGWAVGDLGALIKTTDGGSSWKVIETNTTLPILKVRSYNGQTVIASGYDGLILRSVDGGETFTQITSGVTGDLWGLELVNDTLGWACGATTLLKTTDAGESWQIINTLGYTGNLWAIEFLNNSYGFIAADGKVLRTTNEGNNWEIIQAGDNQSLYVLDIIDSLHIAAAGYGGTSYRGKNMYSSDGGYTWINGGPLTFEPVNDIKYVNRDTGYVVMNNIIGWKTTNRGAEWIPAVTGGEWELQFFKEEYIGYSVGTGLRIYKTENSFENWQRLIINDNFSDVFFINENVGFAISGVLSLDRGLDKTNDGGIHWKGIPGPSGEDILFLDSLTGLIGSDVIYKTTDGGVTWYMPNGGQGGAGKIFFVNETTGWAIRSNIIYKTTDKGENWFTQFAAPSSVGFNSIYFVDSIYGWTANSNGRPYRTTDGGNNWIQQTSVNIGQSLDVFFKDYLNGFLLESNKLYKTTNGGMSFNIIPSITGFSIAGKFSNYADSIIFISGYKCYRSIDGGNSWFNFSELDGIRINSLNLLEPGFGYAVGELGIILKHYDSTVPVELISFSAKLEKNIVSLKWETATETNNQGFLIERNKAGESNWIDLAFISGAGTSTSINYYKFIDELFQFGKYKYRLKQIDLNGKYEFSNEIGIDYLHKIDFSLSQNFPNPFNPSTKINFSVPLKTFVKIILYDVTGREVKSIIEQEMDEGNYELQLNSNGISSGVYYYKMITSSGFNAVNKLIIIK